jgi:hypothetical protein
MTLIFSFAAEAREKTDVLVLRNGDRITGEIRKLEYGKLQFKTSDIGTLSVEWSAVASLSSGYNFDVELVNGLHFYGALSVRASGNGVVVNQLPEPVELSTPEIARIAQIEKGWLDRITGSFSLGYNFAKSSEVTVLSAHLDASYRARTIAMNLRADTTSTNTAEEGTLDRNSVAFTYQWLRPKRRYWAALTSFERNEELGIEGRFQVGGGYGYYLRQNTSSEFSALAGLAASKEWIVGTQDSQGNLEGLFGASWRLFRFKSPETSLTSGLTLFPSLSDSGRYRGNLNLSLRREIIDNFFLDLSTYYDYDSRPPGEDAEDSDYGVVTSLGYSF